MAEKQNSSEERALRVKQALDTHKGEFYQRDNPDHYDMIFAASEKIPIEEITSPQTKSLIERMKKTQECWIGLAANQIGAHLQLFMIQFKCDVNNPRYKDFQDIPLSIYINPRIISASEETVSFWHGCLSALSSEMGKVATWRSIGYEAYDENGTLQKGQLSGLGAIIFQHEFRHLLGSTYVEHAHEFMTREAIAARLAADTEKAMQPCGPEVPHLLADYTVGDHIEEYQAKQQILRPI